MCLGSLFVFIHTRKQKVQQQKVWDTQFSNLHQAGSTGCSELLAITLHLETVSKSATGDCPQQESSSQQHTKDKSHAMPVNPPEPGIQQLPCT